MKVRRLRSPWTIVALVPVCFLVGFTVVTALASDGGGGTPEQAAQPVVTGGGEAAPEPGAEPEPVETLAPDPTEGDAGEEPAEPEPSSPVAGGPPPLYVPPPAPDDSGAPPPGPPPGEIEVDYGKWAKQFRIRNPKLVKKYGSATVTGGFRYLGGGECHPLNVEMRGLYYDEERDPVGQGFWETEWALGAGRLPVKEWLEMEVWGMVRREAFSAEIRIYKVTCG
jgi:hypothetical protein